MVDERRALFLSILRILTGLVLSVRRRSRWRGQVASRSKRHLKWGLEATLKLRLWKWFSLEDPGPVAQSKGKNSMVKQEYMLEGITSEMLISVNFIYCPAGSFKTLTRSLCRGYNEESVACLNTKSMRQFFGVER